MGVQQPANRVGQPVAGPQINPPLASHSGPATLPHPQRCPTCPPPPPSWSRAAPAAPPHPRGRRRPGGRGGPMRLVDGAHGAGAALDAAGTVGLARGGTQGSARRQLCGVCDFLGTRPLEQNMRGQRLCKAAQHAHGLATIRTLARPGRQFVNPTLGFSRYRAPCHRRPPAPPRPTCSASGPSAAARSSPTTC